MPRTTSSTRTSRSPRTSWQQPRHCRSKRPPWTRLTSAAVTSTRRPMPPCGPATWTPPASWRTRSGPMTTARSQPRTHSAGDHPGLPQHQRPHASGDRRRHRITAALEQIHQQLVTDDLPRTRRDWLGKVDADLNQGLRALLQQIDVDRRRDHPRPGPDQRRPGRGAVPARLAPGDRAGRPSQQQPAGVPEGRAGLYPGQPAGGGPVQRRGQGRGLLQAAAQEPGAADRPLPGRRVLAAERVRRP